MAFAHTVVAQQVDIQHEHRQAIAPRVYTATASLTNEAPSGVRARRRHQGSIVFALGSGANQGSIPAAIYTRTVSAFKSKVGSVEFSDNETKPSFPPKYYLQRDETWVGTSSSTNTWSSSSGGASSVSARESNVSSKTTSQCDPLSGKFIYRYSSATENETGSGHSYYHHAYEGDQEDTKLSFVGNDGQWKGTDTYNWWNDDGDLKPITLPINSPVFNNCIDVPDHQYPPYSDFEITSNGNTINTLALTKITNHHDWGTNYSETWPDALIGQGDFDETKTTTLSNEYTTEKLRGHVDALLLIPNLDETEFGKGWIVDYDAQGAVRKISSGTIGVAEHLVSRVSLSPPNNQPTNFRIEKARLQYKLSAKISPASGNESYGTADLVGDRRCMSVSGRALEAVAW